MLRNTGGIVVDNQPWLDENCDHSVPGVGSFGVAAISLRDYPQVQAFVLLVSVSFVLANLAVDILYAFLDPRIRYEQEAVKALAQSQVKVLGRHVLPNCLAPIIVTSTHNIGKAIIIEASLCFLGLGTQPPTPTWGWDLKQNLTFKKGLPYLDRIEIRVIRDPIASMTALRSGEVDFLQRVNPQHVPIMEGAKGVTVVTGPDRMPLVCFMNMRKPPFDDVRVRQAIAAMA